MFFIFTHSFKEIGALPFNLKENVVGVIPNDNAILDCVIFPRAISASKFGNTFSPLFLDFSLLHFKVYTNFRECQYIFSIFRDFILIHYIFILIFRDFGVIINLVRDLKKEG